MTMELIRNIAEIESSDNYHCVRILILLSKSQGNATIKAIDGLSKLAKMDFFMQYPKCLKRAAKLIKRTPDIEVLESEANSIGSKMYYFKYAPWDYRYRKWISLLQARGLVISHTKGNTVHVEITMTGMELAQQIQTYAEYALWRTNGAAVIKIFSSMSGAKISKFISDEFPEILDLKSGEEFSL